MPAVQFGPELLINGIKTGDQFRPAITATANGGFVVVWQDTSLGGTENQDDIRFARFDAFGSRLTGATDTLAVDNPIGSQQNPSIAAFSDGKFVVAWTDANGTPPDIQDRAVRFQIFNADGTESGTVKIANTTYWGSQDQQSIAVLSNGNIVVTWSSEIQNESGARDIIRRVFDSSGNSITGELTVNTQTVGNQTNPTVHALSGGFAVAWQDDEDGPAAGNEFKTFIRFYNENGTALANPVRLDTTTSVTPKSVDFAELEDGKIVVLWTEEYPFAVGADGSGSTIRARIYDPVAGTFAAAIQVNATEGNDQMDARIAALPDGQFVVVWTDKSQTDPDDSFAAVRMQVFNATGGKVGSEILVNDQVNFEQANPVISVLRDGRFVVAWEDQAQTAGDTSGYAVRAQVYDARVAGVTVNGTTLNDSYQGSAYADTINGLNGADTIKGGDGIDIIAGGIGADFLFGDGGNDDIDGGDGNDEIEGGAGADTLDGGIGNDKITGGVGADVMSGGAGNDTYYVDAATDVVNEGPGGGYDIVISSVTYSMPVFVEELQLTGTANLNATGINAVRDILKGNSGANLLTGLGGNDMLVGGEGADTLDGGIGDDTLYGGLGADVLTGGDGIDIAHYSDAVSGTLIVNLTTPSLNTGSALGDTYSGIEGIAGGLTNDTITGNASDNRLYGNAGTDTLNGGGGADALWGGTGADVLNGGNGFDYARYDQGRVVTGTTVISLAFPGSNTGDAAGDSYLSIEGLIGTNGADRITGNSSDNTLYGQIGNDRIDGRTGLDTLFGGQGNDIFMFTTALSTTGRDRIEDFASGRDKIFLAQSIYNKLGTSVSSGELRIGASAVDADDFLVYNKATGELAFDADANGGQAKQVFAVLDPSQNISANDFILTLL